MQELTPTAGAKPAPFVPRLVQQDRETTLQQKPRKPRKAHLTKRELRELSEHANLYLGNLLLRLDYCIAKGDHHIKGIEPLWSATPILIKVPKQGRGRPPKQMVNGLKPYLENMMFAKDVLRLPGLDDIMSGAVAADLDGNTRPLNKKKMASLLQRLDVISAENVEREMGCGERHAQKVAVCLRTIVTLGLRLAGSWPYFAHTDEHSDIDDHWLN